LFLWTKHPAAVARPGPLREAVRALPNVLVHLTITGLGGGPLEPRVPSFREALARVPALLDALGGDPRRVLWRFDPVIPGLSSREDFARLAGRLAALGVRRCISSFLSTMSLKGSLLPQYARFGLAPASTAERVEWAGALGARARAEGLELLLCCQPKVVERLGGEVGAAACIDAALATALHPEGRTIADAKDPSQRRHCRCAPSLDVGDYGLHACRSGCGYCYSKAGGPDVPDS
jgi:DNA repair photolyase